MFAGAKKRWKQHFSNNNNNNTKQKKNKKNKNQTVISQESIPLFKINLKTPAIDRWKPIIKVYHKQVAQLIQSILQMDVYFMTEEEKEANPDFFSNLTKDMFQRLTNLGGIEYVNEMKGIAEYFESVSDSDSDSDFKITIEHVLLSHLLYESMCGCTTVITSSMVSDDNTTTDAAQPQPQKQRLIMGRTLDWMDFSYLRELTIDIDVYNGDQYLYRFTTFAGYVGCLTAHKFSQFAFAVNFREYSTFDSDADESNAPQTTTTTTTSTTDDGNVNQHVDGNKSDANENNDCWPIGFLGRYICERTHCYAQALALCLEAPLMAPAYIVICNGRQAMQITRDERLSLWPLLCDLSSTQTRNAMPAVNTNNSNTAKMSYETIVECQYLLQTNVDHWLFDTESDHNNNNVDSQTQTQNRNKNKKNKKKRQQQKQKQLMKNARQDVNDIMDSVSRIRCARKFLQKHKYQLNAAQMWGLLGIYPIHEKQWTIFSSVIDVESNFCQSFRHLY